MGQPRQSSGVPPAIVALVGWLLPGAGYWLIGKRGRALTIGITILLLFALGLLIGGMKVVAVPPMGMASASVGWRGFIMQNPWFIAQVLTGPAGLVCGYVANSPVFVTSHAHSAEIGTLYTAIAGMLNLLAIIDSSYRAGRGENA